MPREPNFFLVGAPKCGTTALNRYLDQHPAIYMSPIKEPHFFADEIRLENFTDDFRAAAERRLPAQGGPVTQWAEYLKLFQDAGYATAIGEASPCYLWSPTAPANIAARFPDAKILMILRNPIERALSQYAHMLSFAKAPLTFSDYLDSALANKSTRIGELYPFLLFGLYHDQILRYRSYFPASNTRIVFHEDFTRDPRAMLREIFQFLAVDPDFVPDLSLRHMEARVPRSFWLKNALKQVGIRDRIPEALRKRLRPLAFAPRAAIAMSEAERARLREYYRDDIVKLSALLNRDLAAWLSGSRTIAP